MGKTPKKSNLTIIVKSVFEDKGQLVITATDGNVHRFSVKSLAEGIQEGSRLVIKNGNPRVVVDQKSNSPGRPERV